MAKKATKGRPLPKTPALRPSVALPQTAGRPSGDLPQTAGRPSVALPQSGADAAVLDRLWAVILDRRGADPAVSHSARLLGRGIAKVAQKFGEESVECLIEAVSGNAPALVAESADVLYHLLVLWVAAGVEPSLVWAELARREGVSGVAEKAARSRVLPQGGRTKKIP